MSKKVNKKITTRRIVLCLFVGFILWLHYNPLVSDEKIIAHFYAHREEIEALVHEYRLTPHGQQPSGTPHWLSRPETKVRMQQVGLRWFTVDTVWRPDPYSLASMKTFSQQTAKSPNPWDFMRTYSEISISLLKTEQFNYRYKAAFLDWFRPRLVSKSLAYVPALPKIENGYLYRPVMADWYQSKSRIFNSLNDLPFEWERGTCLYRQIEPYWFIKACRAAL